MLLNYLSTAPDQFTTSDLMEWGLSHNMTRGEIKGGIARNVANGRIRLVTAGKGRRPSTYEKNM